MSLEEIKNKLDYITNTIRQNLDVNNSQTRMCKESSLHVLKLCERLDIPYIPFSMGELGMPELEHHFGITGFQTEEYGQICFLIDLTYIQFTEKKYYINVKDKSEEKLSLSPGNFISDENKNNLLQNGYLILTEETFNDYLGCFIEANKLANKIDEQKIYQKAHILLKKFGINFAEEDYLNNRTVKR